jgi:putative spermidine/putrescine transport system permease protein
MNSDQGLPIPPVRRLWLYAVGAVAMFFLVAPSLIIIPMSFSDSQFLQFPPPAWSLRWYDAYFGSVEWRDATYVSIKAAVATTLLATPLGAAAAYALHAGKFRLAGLIQVILAVPLIVPVILIGIGTFFLYAWIGINNTILGLVVAHTVLAIPLVAITVLSGLRTYDMNQELVARSLGANRWRAFAQVTFPQIQFSIVSGALFAFNTSFDESVVSFFISGGETSTLTRRMFSALRDQIDPTIAAISTCLIALSVVLNTLAQTLGRKRTSPRSP